MIGPKPNKRSINGQWLLLAAAVLWGTTGTAQALAPDGATPLSIGAVRLVLGGSTLLILAWVKGGLNMAARLPFWPTLIAATGIAGYQLAFFSGVSRTGVAVGTIVGIGSAPIWAGIMDWLVVKERPGKRWLAATTLAIVGCGLLIAGGGSVDVDPIGVLLAMGAGFSYAIYTLTGKQLLHDRDPDMVMAVIYTLGAIFLLPTLIGSNLSWIFQPRGAIVALHLGLITTALAYALFARGLNQLSVSTAVTLSLAEPLTAGALGMILLNERLELIALLGVGLLLAGLALLSFWRVPVRVTD